MKRFIAAIALSAGFAGPALATSCNEFMTMDTAGQAAAKAAMALPSDLSPAASDSTAADAQVAAVRQACEADPDVDVEKAVEMMGG